jgi:hypothetical protein
MIVKAYPNPVSTAQTLYIDADIDENLLHGAVIDVYSISGTHIERIKVQGRLTTLTLRNYVTGAYLFVLNGNGFRKDLKVVVE